MKHPENPHTAPLHAARRALAIARLEAKLATNAAFLVSAQKRADKAETEVDRLAAEWRLWLLKNSTGVHEPSGETRQVEALERIARTLERIAVSIGADE